MFILTKKSGDRVTILDTNDGVSEVHNLSVVVDWIKKKKVSVVGIKVFGDEVGDLWIDFDEVRQVNNRYHLGLII